MDFVIVSILIKIYLFSLVDCHKVNIVALQKVITLSSGNYQNGLFFVLLSCIGRLGVEQVCTLCNAEFLKSPPS